MIVTSQMADCSSSRRSADPISDRTAVIATVDQARCDSQTHQVLGEPGLVGGGMPAQRCGHAGLVGGCDGPVDGVHGGVGLVEQLGVLRIR
jgi:hypothetical protein